MSESLVSFLGTIVAASALAVVQCGTGRAEEYPVKPIRLLVGMPAGSTLDSTARILSNKLSERLRQSVIIDNRSGAGGIIAAEIVAHARPDGYTLLWGASGALTVNPNLSRDLSYNPVRDFAPIVRTVNVATILVANPSLPANSVRELIALTKTKPLLGGFAGVGTPGHLAIALFNDLAGTHIQPVAYKGANSAMLADLMSGAISIAFGTSTLIPLIQSNKVKALAVCSAKRSALLPELPTVAEAGIEGLDVTGWYGVFAPSGTPRAIVDRLNAETQTILGTADIRRQLFSQGVEVDPSNVEEFSTQLRTDIARWAKVIKASGIKID